MHEPLNPRQEQVEAMLRRVAPAPVALRRDEVMYAAGRAAAKSGMRVRAWQGACFCLVLVCAGVVWLRPGPVRERTIVVHDSAPAAVAAAADMKPLPMNISPPRPDEHISPGATYLELRTAVLTRGLDVLRAAPATGNSGVGSSPPALEGMEAVPEWQRLRSMLQGDHS